MRRTFLFFLFLLLAIRGLSQNDHLEPIRNIRSYDEWTRQNMEHNFAMLYAGMNASPYARYAASPSFSKEYAFSAERTTNGYYLISNTFSENYWYAADKDSVKVICRKHTIDKQLFQLIGNLFNQATVQIKRVPMDLGLDGTTYYFATTDKHGNLRIGVKWSPLPNSLMDRLVKVCDNLYALAVGSELSLPELKNEMKTLTTDLKKYGKKYKHKKNGK